MAGSLARLAGKSVAVVAVAAGMTVAGASMASAGEIVVTDNGHQCGVALKNDDGSYTDWWNQ